MANLKPPFSLCLWTNITNNYFSKSGIVKKSVEYEKGRRFRYFLPIFIYSTDVIIEIISFLMRYVFSVSKLSLLIAKHVGLQPKKKARCFLFSLQSVLTNRCFANRAKPAREDCSHNKVVIII